MKRQRLIEARRRAGLTQAQVAKIVGVTASYYGMIEQGVRTPRLSLALTLERIFDVPAAELFPDLFFATKPNAAFGKKEVKKDEYST